MIRPIVSKATPRVLVACNVYVSAGHAQYSDLLLKLLRDAQEHCRTARAKTTGVVVGSGDARRQGRVVIVHAFCDGPYDRSSFHIAGSPILVASVASRLATCAVESLDEERIRLRTKHQTNLAQGIAGANGGATPHPTVGLVDHVSVLPLDPPTYIEHNGDDRIVNPKENDIPVTGWVAHQIGEALQEAGVQVLYYGHADLPSQRPLATVRRESTDFFRSATDSVDDNLCGATRRPLRGQATVGAPEFFTENFNIRLRPQTPKAVAQSLTRHVRARDGGLPFVEALTLPYGRDRYEVACNLLRPSVTSARDIEDHVQGWEPNATGKSNLPPADAIGDSNLVECAYRVGTTTEMCIDALDATQELEGEEAHNLLVMRRFQDFICSNKHE